MCICMYCVIQYVLQKGVMRCSVLPILCCNNMCEHVQCMYIRVGTFVCPCSSAKYAWHLVCLSKLVGLLHPFCSVKINCAVIALPVIEIHLSICF